MSVQSVLSILLFSSFVFAQTEYVVKKGDTLLKIADRSLGNTDRNNPERYDFVKRLVKLNPSLKDPNALEPGQTILVPGESQAEVKSAAPVSAAAASENVTEPVVVLKPAEGSAGHVVSAAETPPPPAPAVNPVPVQEAVNDQTAAEADHKAHEEKQEGAHHNFFFVQPRYSLVEIISKDEVTHDKAKMKSDSSVGLDLQYGWILNERFHLLFQGGVTHTQFGDLKGVTATVNHKKETLKTFAAGVAYEASHSLHLDLMAFYAEHTFLNPHGAGEYELHAIAFPGAELNISWDFFSRGTHILGVSAIAEYLAEVKKDGVTYDSIVEPVGAVYWKSNRGPGKVNYKATVTYKHTHQETSLAKKAEDMTTLGVGFYF